MHVDLHEDCLYQITAVEYANVAILFVIPNDCFRNFYEWRKNLYDEPWLRKHSNARQIGIFELKTDTFPLAGSASYAVCVSRKRTTVLIISDCSSRFGTDAGRRSDVSFFRFSSTTSEHYNSYKCLVVTSRLAGTSEEQELETDDVWPAWLRESISCCISERSLFQYGGCSDQMLYYLRRNRNWHPFFHDFPLFRKRDLHVYSLISPRCLRTFRFCRERALFNKSIFELTKTTCWISHSHFHFWVEWIYCHRLG